MASASKLPLRYKVAFKMARLIHRDLIIANLPYGVSEWTLTNRRMYAKPKKGKIQELTPKEGTK